MSHVSLCRIAGIAVLVAGAVLQMGCDGAATATAGLETQETSRNEIVPDELIVTVLPGADPNDLDELFNSAGATVRERLDQLSVILLGVDPDLRDEAATTLSDSPLVEDVYDNRVIDLEITPNDPIYPIQWHLAAIEAPRAWGITTGSEQILVAVVDTGVDREHPDLATKLRPGGNTYDGSADWSDTNGHGTEVAGIIGAAADSQAGVASVAWKNPMIPIRATGADEAATSWSLAAGIALAVNEGAKVINVSFAPLQADTLVLRQAELARLAGALVVFPTGNTGLEASGPGSDAALFVGAVDQDGVLAPFSTFGSFVDIAAPGVSIYTTRKDGQFGRSSGSSFAAPVVSGVAALVWSVNPDLRPATVRGILLSTATDLGTAGDDVRFGAGQVNALAAVQLAQVIEEQQDERAPTVAIRRPADGASVSGTINIEVEVTDDSDLADVTLALDGATLAIDASAPYTFILNTARYARGTHVLTATATDVFGNAADFRISLSFDSDEDTQAPGVTMESPPAGGTVRGVITILAEATDDRALSRGEVLIDSKLAATVELAGVGATITHSWDTTTVTEGSHTITVRVFDTSGNANSASVAVTVQR